MNVDRALPRYIKDRAEIERLRATLAESIAFSQRIAANEERLTALNAELMAALEEIAIDRLSFRTEGPWTAQGIARAAIAKAKETTT